MCILQHCGEGCWVGAELGRLVDAGASPSRYGGTLTLPHADHRHAHSTLPEEDGVGREHAFVIGGAAVVKVLV